MRNEVGPSISAHAIDTAPQDIMIRPSHLRAPTRSSARLIRTNVFGDGKAEGSGSHLTPTERPGMAPPRVDVFRPPNLRGFVMARSYYPSEWLADYSDIARIEALKPAIETCGKSTPSQSPM